MKIEFSRTAVALGLAVFTACATIHSAKEEVGAKPPAPDPDPNSVIHIRNHKMENPGYRGSAGDGYQVPLKRGREYQFEARFSNPTVSKRWVLIYLRRNGIPDARCSEEDCWERVESFSTDNLNRDPYSFRPEVDMDVLIATWNEGGATNPFGATHKPDGKDAFNGGTRLRFRGPTPAGPSVQTIVTVSRV